MHAQTNKIAITIEQNRNRNQTKCATASQQNNNKNVKKSYLIEKSKDKTTKLKNHT